MKLNPRPNFQNPTFCIMLQCAFYLEDNYAFILLHNFMAYRQWQ